MAELTNPKHISIQLVERRRFRLRSHLLIRYTGPGRLGPGWRLYFSMGLSLYRPDARLRRVLLDGRYGYLEPAKGWQPLKSGKAIRIRLEPWLFAGTRLADRQGFHLAALAQDSKGRVKETLLGAPLTLPAQLAPLRPQPDIRRLSPSCDARPQDPRREYRRHAATPSADPSLFVIPAVKRLEATGPSLALGGFQIQAPPELVGEQARLAEFLPQKAGGKPAALSLDPALPEGGYALDTGPEGIAIKGKGPAEVFYGVQTLRQLLGPGRPQSLPAVSIQDKPDFQHRGLFIDLARHFHGLAQLKRIITAMAAYKLNRLQLGFCNDEGWRLEIPAIPELTEMGATRAYRPSPGSRHLNPAWGDGHQPVQGFLSQQDFIDLLAHARERHVEVIPEFNLPGHAAALIQCLAASGRYEVTDPQDASRHRSAQGYANNVVNVCLPGTYQFAEAVLEAIKACYDRAGVPLARLHLGGDEVPEGAWLGSPACRRHPLWQPEWKMNNPQDRQAATAALSRHYLQSITEVAAKACPGAQLGFWHEMSQHTEGQAPGAYYTCWATEAGERQAVQRLLADGKRFVICNASYLYFDMPQSLAPAEPGLPWAAITDARRVHGFAPLAVWQIPPDQAQQVLGLQAQLWSETLHAPALVDWQLFPRSLAFAERCWNSRPAQDWPQFAAALGKRELPHLHSLGLGFRVPPPGLRRRRGRIEANVAYPGLEVAYTTDGASPSAKSPRLAPGASVKASPGLQLAAIEPISQAASHPVSWRGTRLGGEEGDV